MKNKTRIIAGPCVIEDESTMNEIASQLKVIAERPDVEFYFKASFDKANRTSIHGFRGPGLEKGLNILADIQKKFGYSLLTDVHNMSDVDPVAKIVDVLQIPAFLCRQTDLVVATFEAALKYGRIVNIKKGQFLAPWDMSNVLSKGEEVRLQKKSSRTLAQLSWITERGTSFGYNRLVVDMGSYSSMRALGVPLIHDCTHSVQLPGGAGSSTDGKREWIRPISRAAAAAGADGFFMEVHPNPSQAKSDGPNALPLEQAAQFVDELLKIQACVRDFV